MTAGLTPKRMLPHPVRMRHPPDAAVPKENQDQNKRHAEKYRWVQSPDNHPTCDLPHEVSEHAPTTLGVLIELRTAASTLQNNRVGLKSIDH